MNVDSIISELTKGKQLPQQSIFAHDWLSWYRGNVMGFHNYSIFNGAEHIPMNRKTLQMAKQVAETWANLLMNERCDIVLPEAENDKLQEILNRNNFWIKANEGIETSFAVGLGALIINVRDLQIGEKSKILKKDSSWINIEFIDRFKMYPITIEHKEITECAFVSEGTDKIHVVIHLKNDKGHYTIHNRVIDKKANTVEAYDFDTKSDKRWFFILRPNIANNLRTATSDDEIGMSIFANSIDTLKSIDNKYDGFDLEFVLGRKRIFVDTAAFNFRTKKDQNGNIIKEPTFDPYDYMFHHLPENTDGKRIITDQSGELRHTSFIDSINAELNILSMKCGLGENYYKFNGGIAATATQVISENSTLYRSIKKHEILLESTLRNLVKTIIYASTEFTNIKFGNILDNEIKVIFDDSIIEDREAEMTRDRADVQSGIMTSWEYRAKWYGETEKDAEAYYLQHFRHDIIGKYMSALQSGAMTPELFVEICYKDIPDKTVIVEYVKNYLESAPMTDTGFIYAGREGEPEPEDDTETTADTSNEDDTE